MSAMSPAAPEPPRRRIRARRLLAGFALVVIAGLVGVRLASALTGPPAGLGVRDGRLAACPGSPNCVSSQAPPADAHRVEPLRYTGPRGAALARLIAAVEGLPGARLVERRDDYLRVECTSRLFRFVDDLELYLPPGEEGVVHVRSASRVGHSDLGVNRARVEALRAAVGAW